MRRFNRSWDISISVILRRAYGVGRECIHLIRPAPCTLRPALILLALFLPACTLTPTPAPPGPPDRLYVFDVGDLHLNHSDHCLALTGKAGVCQAETPPPGKSYPTLLQDYDTLIFVTTLQGIVNRREPRLYLTHDRARDERPGLDAFWLERYQEADRPYGWLAGVEIIPLRSLNEVLDTFAGEVAGLVVWDTAVPATLNVATTIAGVEDLAVLRAGSAIEAEVKQYLPVKRSLVGMFQPQATTLPDSDTPATGSTKADAYLWAKETYLDTGRANPRFLAYLEDGWPAARYSRDQMTRGGVYALERDYVVHQRGFAFDLSPWPDEPPLDDPTQPLGTDAETFEKIVSAAADQAGGALIKVWGFIPWYEKYAAAPEAGLPGRHTAVAGEWQSTWLFSQYGAYLQGGGGDVFGLALANVSVHTFGPVPAQRPPPRPPAEAELIAKGYLTTAGRVSPDHTFVLFYVGDYDLAHPTAVLLGNYHNRPWLDPRRGDLPLAWGLNPGLVEDIPAMMTYFYTTQTDQDYFVGPNSGAGYLNLDALPETTLLRWVGRSKGFYAGYGYTIQGFLLNGEGAAMSQRRLDAFTFVAPDGLLTPDFETDEPWPRLQWGTPLSAVASEALAGPPDVAAEAVHTAYRRTVGEEGRPPFLVFRSAFQSPTFLEEVRDRLQAHEAQGSIEDDKGRRLHPNYTVVDPYTFFFLLERWLRTPRENQESGVGNW